MTNDTHTSGGSTGKHRRADPDIGVAPSLRVEHLSIAYTDGDGRRVSIVEDFDLELSPGELVCIVGRSGSGKTSILRHLAGFEQPAPGTVWWGPDDVCDMNVTQLADLRRFRAAYIDQESALLEELTCLENVLLPLMPNGRRAVRAARSRAEAVLTELGLGRHLNARPRTLSGGERQRTAVARALVTEAPTVLADEPTASLDRRWADHVAATLRSRANAGHGILAVSHDPGLAEAADRTITLPG